MSGSVGSILTKIAIYICVLLLLGTMQTGFETLANGGSSQVRDVAEDFTSLNAWAILLTLFVLIYELFRLLYELYGLVSGSSVIRNLGRSIDSDLNNIEEESKVPKNIAKDAENLDLKNLAEKAQYDFKDYKISIAPYRGDILHPYDVIEDIGIMYGFEKIKDAPLATYTIGSGLKLNEFIDRVREIAAGLGYQEIVSAVLTNKDYLYNKMNTEDTGTVEIAEYMSETYSVVRSWVLPNLIEVFSKNKHVTFPQKIFEEGLVNVRKGEKIEEFHRIAIASSSEDTNYTEARQALDLIMKLFGLKYDIEETEHSSFISGRVGRAIVKGKKVAYLGEISPKVLENWGLDLPVAALELNLTELFEVMGKNKSNENKS